MDYKSSELLICFLISVVILTRYVVLCDVLSMMNSPQHKEVASLIPRGTKIGLDANNNRLGTYQYAGYKNSIDRIFFGVQGEINIWPLDVIEGDFSATRLLIGAPHQGLGTYIGAGIMVNKERFNDSHPRFFAFYTYDNFARICYTFNPSCAGLVKHEEQYFTQPIARNNLSVYDGNQYDVSIKIDQDPDLKIWTLKLENTLVGYWPAEKVPALYNGASKVEWSGQVFTSILSPRPDPMGSGNFPEMGYKKASYIKSMKYVSVHRLVAIPTTSMLEPYLTDNSSYRVSNVELDNTMGVHFYYGGPGNHRPY